jgi:hypothetical protein
MANLIQTICLFKISFRGFNKIYKELKMDFLSAVTVLVIAGGAIACFMNCVLKEDSKFFQRMEKLF